MTTPLFDGAFCMIHSSHEWFEGKREEEEERGRRGTNSKMLPSSSAFSHATQSRAHGFQVATREGASEGGMEEEAKLFSQSVVAGATASLRWG